MALYQHPALVPCYEPLEVSEAIERCPKLAAVLGCLHSIRAKGEKTLIFTRSLNMQQLLVSVLNTEFGLNVDIINGATSRRGDTRSGNHTRKAIVNRFRESRGFNVLVLSPDVAGIGLTLVEAQTTSSITGVGGIQPKSHKQRTASTGSARRRMFTYTPR